MKKVLLVHALNQEKIEITKAGYTFYDCITGVGKVNAAIAVQQAIYLHQPSCVLNVGTCGSLQHEIGSIHTCNHFVDRDMEKLVEFGLNCRHNFSEEVKVCAPFHHWQFHSICNTGDAFLTTSDGTGDIFDMEAFAIAQVCKTLQIPFVSIKYVTDIIGQNSVKQWEDKLNDARTALEKYVNNLKF